MQRILLFVAVGLVAFDLAQSATECAPGDETCAAEPVAGSAMLQAARKRQPQTLQQKVPPDDRRMRLAQMRSVKRKEEAKRKTERIQKLLKKSRSGTHSTESYPQWCSSRQTFNASKVLHQTCNLTKEVSPHDCQMSGCYSYEAWWEDPVMTVCSCYDKHACEGVGGDWIDITCAVMASHEEVDAMTEANEAGSCKGITTSWGDDLTEVLSWHATMCCTDAPKTFCEADFELKHPCIEGDFNPDHEYDWGQCHLEFPEPNRTVCNGAGCDYWQWDGHCHCDEKEPCKSLGGEWDAFTCGEYQKWWITESRALKEAEETGTCDGITLWGWDPVEDWVNDQAEICCKSYPKTACDPEANATHY